LVIDSTVYSLTVLIVSQQSLLSLVTDTVL
jgi:hypothetical protein